MLLYSYTLILCEPNDLANHWTDIFLLYGKAFHTKVYSYFREIATQPHPHPRKKHEISFVTEPTRRSNWRDCGSDLARVAVTRKRSDVTHDRYPRLRKFLFKIKNRLIRTSSEKISIVLYTTFAFRS